MAGWVAECAAWVNAWVGGQASGEWVRAWLGRWVAVDARMGGWAKGAGIKRSTTVLTPGGNRILMVQTNTRVQAASWP